MIKRYIWEQNDQISAHLWAAYLNYCFTILSFTEGQQKRPLKNVKKPWVANSCQKCIHKCSTEDALETSRIITKSAHLWRYTTEIHSCTYRRQFITREQSVGSQKIQVVGRYLVRFSYQRWCTNKDWLCYQQLIKIPEYMNMYMPHSMSRDGKAQSLVAPDWDWDWDWAFNLHNQRNSICAKVCNNRHISSSIIDVLSYLVARSGYFLIEDLEIET